MRHIPIWFASCLVILLTPVEAMESCRTMAEARKLWPNTHLWWFRGGSDKCWINSRNGSRKFKGATKKPGPKPIRGDDPNGNKAQEIQPRPHETTIWPTLAINMAAIDPQWFSTEHSTEWPRLLDVDQLTSDAELPDCCWPALEQQVAFNDRWDEVPRNWPQSNANKGEAIWTVPIRR